MPDVYTVYPHALTNLVRVKNRLGITTTGLDNLINTLINATTDYIEGETNRRFLRATISQEIHSIRVHNKDILVVKQAPIVSISSIEYAVGIGSSKTWAAYSPTIYEMLENGSSGMVKVFGGMLKGSSNVRISYVGGYLIDFTHYGDTTQHNLPADLTDLCERLVTRLLKRREAEGKSSEGFNGSSITWQKDLDNFDQKILDGYKRLPEFV